MVNMIQNETPEHVDTVNILRCKHEYFTQGAYNLLPPVFASVPFIYLLSESEHKIFGNDVAIIIPKAL